MKLIVLLFIAAFIFCLTYDPKSGRIESLVNGVTVTQGEKPLDGCCSDNSYMANNSVQCRPAHFQGNQFANPDYGCPQKHPETFQGAIIGR